MTRELIHDELASQRLDALEEREDPTLTRKIRDVEDAIAAGEGWVKRGPFTVDIDGTTTRAWLHVLEHGRERWAMTWSVIDEQTVKIHAVEPTVSL